MSKNCIRITVFLNACNILLIHGMTSNGADGLMARNKSDYYYYFFINSCSLGADICLMRAFFLVWR